MPASDPIAALGAEQAADRRVPAAAWLVIFVLALSLVALNHNFDVVAGRFDETVESGAQLHTQEASEGKITGGTILRKAGLVGLVATGLLALLLAPVGVRFRWSAVTILTCAVLFWTTASLLWSTDPTKTAHELIRLYAYGFTSLILATRLRIRELIWMFLGVCLVAIGCDVGADVAAGTFRPWQSDFRMGGALHPNHVGRLGGIVALIGFAAMLDKRHRRWAWMFFATGFVVVLLSVSRSGLFGMLAGLAAVVFLGVPPRRMVFCSFGLASVVAIGLGVFAIYPPSLQGRLLGAALMGRTDDAASLTGRGPLWIQMWRDGAERRIQGYGYGAYWTVDRNYELAADIDWFPTHSHSIYMELLIDLGFVGLSLYLALTLVIIANFNRLVAESGQFEFRLLGALFVSAMVNGFFEVSFVWPRLEGMFLGIAALALMLHSETDLAAIKTAARGRYLPRFSQILHRN